MNKLLIFPITVLLSLFHGCTNGQYSKTSLSPNAFSEKINQMPDAAIIDVRTPQEFSDGHLIHATNMDWNGDRFEAQVSTLDKSKPVFVYCYSGGRSAAAAKKMRANGFTEVYELAGGFSKWRDAKLPVAND